MDLQLTAEQQAFRAEVRAFIQERLPQDIRDRLRAGHPPRKEDTVRWQRILNERGWAAPHWPRRFGGAELGQAERLILMDEPTGGLDVSVQARLLDLLRGLVADLGLTVVIVTHDLGVARLLADRLMVMQGGRVIESGLTDQVLDDPQHEYTQLLVSSVLQV